MTWFLIHLLFIATKGIDTVVIPVVDMEAKAPGGYVFLPKVTQEVNGNASIWMPI